MLHRKDVIWGFDFISDNKIIFTERSGKMLLFSIADKTCIEVIGLPKIYSAGQAGLLDVRVHPEFNKNNIIYFSFSEPVGKDESTTASVMAVLKDHVLTGNKTIFVGNGPSHNDIHYGSRIEFDLIGHLFLTMRDRDERNKAQDFSRHQGKIFRLNMDGSIPQDNPWSKSPDKRPDVWSYGHRNPQGLARHPVTGELWEAEMGYRGGDEISLIRPSKNYGWPVITYGREYYGPKSGETSRPSMEQPLIFWVPSISPSAIVFYSGYKIPEWKNNLFVATLFGTRLRRLIIDGYKIIKQDELFSELEYRWRNIRNGPDGYLYFSTDEGKLGRIVLK